MDSREVLFKKSFDFNEKIEGSLANIEHELANIQEELQYIGMFFLQEEKFNQVNGIMESIKDIKDLKQTINNTRRTKKLCQKRYYNEDGKLYFYLNENISKVRSLKLYGANIRDVELGAESFREILVRIFNNLDYGLNDKRFFKLIDEMKSKSNYCLSTDSKEFKNSSQIKLKKNRGIVYFNKEASLDRFIKTLIYFGRKKEDFFENVVLIFHKSKEDIPDKNLDFLSLKEHWFKRDPRILIFKNKDISVSNWIDLFLKTNIEILKDKGTHRVIDKHYLNGHIKNYLTYDKNKFKRHKEIPCGKNKIIYMRCDFSIHAVQIKLKALFNELNYKHNILKVGF